MKAYRYSRVFQVFVIGMLVAATCLLGVFWIGREYSYHRETMRIIREDYVAIRKAEVRTIVNQQVESIEFSRNRLEERLKTAIADRVQGAVDVAAAIYRSESGRRGVVEIKQLIIDTLMSLRFFDGRGYYWIHDTDHVLIAHPYRHDSIGMDDSNLVDTKGQFFIRSFVQTALADPQGGFVTYYWNRPGVDERYHVEQGQKKIAYLKQFEPFHWVIGAGEYVDDAEREIRQAAIDRIGTVRYGEAGYIFSHTREGVCLNHINRAVIGKNRWDLEDAEGMKVVQDLDRVGRQPGGGFLEYVASIDPRTGQPAKKLSFIRAVEGWGWVLGGGVYLEDVEKRIADMQRDMKNRLIGKIVTTVGILAAIAAVVFLLSRRLMVRFRSELDLFAAGCDAGVGGQLDPNRFRFVELRDIAEKSNAILKEKALAEAALNQARRMESIGLMAGGVAHDLNNILSGIVGYPDLILHRLSTESPLREPVLRIRESGLRAAAVVADLLTVARGIAVKKTVVDLNVLIGEYRISPQFEALATSHPDIEWRFAASSESLWIDCSPVHVGKCIMNLMTNAAESIAKTGAVTLTTARAEIATGHPQLSAGTYACVVVADTGMGIEPAVLTRVFEPFFTKKTMGRSGTGLGLTVVWNTMLDHHGTVAAESGEGGSVFTLYFPLETSGPDETGQHPAVDTKLTELRGSGTILVVDDEPMQREIVTGMLTCLGYEVSSAACGEEAVNFLRRREVDLVILDMLMPPGIDGCETYRRILAFRPTQKAIIVSGYSVSDCVEETLRLGAGRLVGKPYSMAELALAVKLELED